MEAIILAGGKGSRLQKQVSDVPKPLAPINNQAFLDYILKYLKAYDFKKIILSVGYKHELIMQHYGNNFLGMEIDYAIESKALGTGGGIKLSIQKASNKNVFVLNGDSFFDIDLNQFKSLHKNHKSVFSIALRKNHQIDRFGAVKTDKNNQIIEFAEKGKYKGVGLINTGIYLINKDNFLKFDLAEKFSLEYDFLEKNVNKKQFYGFRFDGYFIDIGVPLSYYIAQNEFRNFKY